MLLQDRNTWSGIRAQAPPGFSASFLTVALVLVILMARSFFTFLSQITVNPMACLK